jgi:hypothetical protein
MGNEKQKVLDLLASGAITTEEASSLLDALEDNSQKNMVAQEEKKRDDAKRMQGKKLRVEVKGDTEEAKRMNVNVSIPLVIARHVDDILANCIPDAASDELKQQGIDIRGIKLGPIIDTFEDLDEDIVNADIDQDETQLTVRVYVE